MLKGSQYSPNYLNMKTGYVEKFLAFLKLLYTISIEDFFSYKARIIGK